MKNKTVSLFIPLVVMVLVSGCATTTYQSKEPAYTRPPEKGSVLRHFSLELALEEKILASCPDSMVNGDRQMRLPNTLNVSFEFIEGESILMMLNQFGICASSGSACTSGSLEPSHVLRAMGVPFTAAHGSIRFSLSRYTTKEEVDVVIEKMAPIVNRLRELSPFVKA